MSAETSLVVNLILYHLIYGCVATLYKIVDEYRDLLTEHYYELPDELRILLGEFDHCRNFGSLAVDESLYWLRLRIETKRYVLSHPAGWLVESE